MVIVLVHHVGHVLLPELVEEFHIVILGLVDIPVVDVLIHHQHSHAVANFQGGLGAGIVGGADGIVAVFLENPQPPFQGIGMAGGTQQAVVMVDAGTPENDSLSVHFHAVIAPGQGADAEGFFVHIFPKGNPGGVEIGMLYAPQLARGNLQLEAAAASGRSNHAAPIQNVHLHIAGDGGFHRHRNDRRGDGDGADFDTVEGNVLLGGAPQLHRAIDASAGVPAGIGLVGVAGNDLNGVFTGMNEAIQLHIKIGVAIGAESGLFAVHEYLSLAVYALKFQHIVLGKLLLGHIPFFCIDVVPSLKPADIQSAFGKSRARL